jgi:hypothetical protein
VLARAGVGPAQPSSFFDDWSHSLLSIVVLASLFAVLFWKQGRRSAVVAVWLSVFSPFLLDFPVHPKRLALYPKSEIRLGWDLLNWGAAQGWLGIINDCWLQFVVVPALLLEAKSVITRPAGGQSCRASASTRSVGWLGQGSRGSKYPATAGEIGKMRI